MSSVTDVGVRRQGGRLEHVLLDGEGLVHTHSSICNDRA